MTVSLRRRLAISVVATVALVFAVIATVLYIGVHNATWRQHDQALAARAHALAAIAEREGEGYEMVLPPQPRDDPPAFIEVWKPDDSVLLRSATLHDVDLPRDFAPADGLAFEDVTLPDGRAGRAVALRFAVRDETEPNPRPLLLVLAEGNEPIDSAVGAVRGVFLGVGILALLVIAGLTAWVVARGTRPLARLAEQIEQIDDRQLGTRLSADGQPRELAVLVRKLDALLSRLEASFVREREFSANVSHELRTPLAGLRTLLEVTALQERTTAEYRMAIADALGVIQQLSAMIENLLALAQIESGNLPVTASDVDLNELVEESWSSYAAEAATRNITFRNRLAKPTAIRTDREKLRIVVGNLFANAAEYTEQGGWIEVTNEACILAVTDSGPAIPTQVIERMFDRLWRGDHARSGNGVHCGIGLALSRSLCELLSLSLSATSATDGHVTFCIARSGGLDKVAASVSRSDHLGAELSPRGADDNGNDLAPRSRVGLVHVVDELLHGDDGAPPKR